ncbi:MAG: FtsW/RodA/SpoVE family cell cycle protein, partial [Evtepia sp.]
MSQKKQKNVSNPMAKGPIDLAFLLLAVLLVAIGLIMVLSASYASAYYDIEGISGNKSTYYFMRQAAFALFGLVVMFGVSKIDYTRYRNIAFLALIGSIILLVLVIIPGVGHTANGATRWIQLPGLQFQPSEFAKLGVILYFSARLSKREDRKPLSFSRRTVGGQFGNWFERAGFFELVPYCIVLLVIIFLLKLEPHMSATILIIVVAASILFAAGIKLGWFVVGGVVVVTGLGLIIMTTDYMTSRIQLWQDPWADALGKGYQAIQSLLAIGSGGLLGLGLGNSRQKFLYLPEEHNDFIFSIICEELGFIGAALILTLFAILIIRGYWIAMHARDRFGTYMVVGVITLL